MSYWSVVDGAIVGTAGEKKIKGNEFLWYKREVGDFHLSLSVRQVPYAANAGIQFRSQPEQAGLHLDTKRMWEKDGGDHFTTSMAEYFSKNKDVSGKHVKREEWNQYEILAMVPKYGFL